MSADQEPITVLVVEDEALIRMLTTDLLADAGYRVLEAADAAEAMRVLEQTDDVQVLFTDIRMPGKMDGLALATLVHERWPSVRLLITSGHRSVEGKDLPDDGRFLPKPYALNAMLDEVRALAAGN